MASQYQLGRSANLKTPFAGEAMWGEVSLPRRQFSNGCQNSKRIYPLTEQFHFWKRSLDIGLHVLKAIDLKAKQSHMYKKKKKKKVWPISKKKNKSTIPEKDQKTDIPKTLK